MKVVYVIDSISNLNAKVDKIKNRFGDEILFVVKSNLVPIFQTYGYTANAVYGKNLAKTIHFLLARLENLEDIVYLKSSLDLTDKLLNKFIAAIGNRSKIVNVLPTYNTFESIGLSCYNVYVKSLFKIEDSLNSSKIQFIPKFFLNELLATHFANKMFQLKPEMVTNIYFEEKEINKNLKEDKKFNKFTLLPIIAALIITLCFVLTVFIAKKVNFIIAILFIFFYSLDFMSAIIMNCKTFFDKRFLK